MKSYIHSEIDNKSEIFYDKILNEFNKQNKNLRLAFILVDHCLLTFQSHINSIQKMGRLAGVILKSSTHIKEAENYARNICNILKITKEQLKIKGAASRIIKENIKDGEKLIILDHGGYFASSLKELAEDKYINQNLLGIVEVTENGHSRYIPEINNYPISLLSLARSKIKELEDTQVGASICDATNTIMYTAHDAMLSAQAVCIIGYGKIGRSIANNCRKRGISETFVIEIDHIRLLMAKLEGHQVFIGSNQEQKYSALQRAQIIFSATGKQVLSAKDIPYFCRSGNSGNLSNPKVLYIASCTSPDDEFNKDFFEQLSKESINSSAHREEVEEKHKLTPYRLFDGRVINILNGGKSVNFAVGGTPGYGICQVWGGILFAAMKIITQQISPKSTIQELTEDDQKIIAAITYNTFFSESNVISKNNSIIKHKRSNSLTGIPILDFASQKIVKPYTSKQQNFLLFNKDSVQSNRAIGLKSLYSILAVILGAKLFTSNIPMKFKFMIIFSVLFGGASVISTKTAASQFKK